MKTLTLNSDLFNTYRHILDLVGKCGAEHVMIAGGAIRDVLLDKEVKDIDVMYSGDLDLNKVYEYFQVNKESGDTFYEDSEFKVPFEDIRLKDCDYPIQLIQVNIPFMEHLESFGVGVSKVAMLADGTLWITPDFMRDITEECLHFNPDLNDKYKERMCDKFPEFMAMDEVVY